MIEWFDSHCHVDEEKFNEDRDTVLERMREHGITRFAVITNLKTAKLAGIESQGMILSAMDDKGNLRLMSVEDGVEDGAIIG